MSAYMNNTKRGNNGGNWDGISHFTTFKLFKVYWNKNKSHGGGGDGWNAAKVIKNKWAWKRISPFGGSPNNYVKRRLRKCIDAASISARESRSPLPPYPRARDVKSSYECTRTQYTKSGRLVAISALLSRLRKRLAGGGRGVPILNHFIKNNNALPRR